MSETNFNLETLHHVRLSRPHSLLLPYTEDYSTYQYANNDNNGGRLRNFVKYTSYNNENFNLPPTRAYGTNNENPKIYNLLNYPIRGKNEYGRASPMNIRHQQLPPQISTPTNFNLIRRKDDFPRLSAENGKFISYNSFRMNSFDYNSNDCYQFKFIPNSMNILEESEDDIIMNNEKNEIMMNNKTNNSNSNINRISLLNKLNKTIINNNNNNNNNILQKTYTFQPSNNQNNVVKKPQLKLQQNKMNEKDLKITRKKSRHRDRKSTEKTKSKLSSTQHLIIRTNIPNGPCNLKKKNSLLTRYQSLHPQTIRKPSFKELSNEPPIVNNSNSTTASSNEGDEVFYTKETIEPNNDKVSSSYEMNVVEGKTKKLSTDSGISTEDNGSYATHHKLESVTEASESFNENSLPHSPQITESDSTKINQKDERLLNGEEKKKETSPSSYKKSDLNQLLCQLLANENAAKPPQTGKNCSRVLRITELFMNNSNDDKSDKTIANDNTLSSSNVFLKQKDINLTDEDDKRNRNTNQIINDTSRLSKMSKQHFENISTNNNNNNSQLKKSMTDDLCEKKPERISNRMIDTSKMVAFDDNCIEIDRHVAAYRAQKKRAKQFNTMPSNIRKALKCQMKQENKNTLMKQITTSPANLFKENNKNSFCKQLFNQQQQQQQPHRMMEDKQNDRFLLARPLKPLMFQVAVNGIGKHRSAEQGLPKKNICLIRGNFGDDSGIYIQTNSHLFIALADGAGGNRQFGINPKSFSNALVKELQNTIEKNDIAPDNLTKIVHRALHAVEKQGICGSSTLCVIVVDKMRRRLRALNIGDSGFALVRNNRIICKSESTLHAGYPKQLYCLNEKFDGVSFIDEQTILDDSHMVTTKINSNDFILLSSDGLFDVLNIDEIERCISNDQTSATVAKTLVNRAVQKYRKKSHDDILTIVAKAVC
ncbi:hypothetical protein SNEBB_003964 [Seison nebaliae]|nr:hypothetical protein SNEBB_003964 [Seison nebaliae]